MGFKNTCAASPVCEQYVFFEDYALQQKRSPIFDMSQTQDRSPEPTGSRYEREMSQLQRDREAEAKAKKEAKAEALRQEVISNFEKEMARSRSKSVTSDGPDDLRNRLSQAEVEDEDENEQLSNGHSNGVPLQASTAMPTPPLNPHPPNTVHAQELDAQYPCDPIQKLTSRLEREERRVTELERELKRARAQLQHYIEDKCSVERLQIQAVVANDPDQIAKLKEQVAELKILVENSRNEVSSLQEEQLQKDRLIDQLRSDIRQKSQELHEERRQQDGLIDQLRTDIRERSQELQDERRQQDQLIEQFRIDVREQSRQLQETAVPVRAQQDCRRSEQQARHGFSGMRLERNNNGIRIRRNASVLPMANSVAFPLT